MVWDEFPYVSYIEDLEEDSEYVSENTVSNRVLIFFNYLTHYGYKRFAPDSGTHSLEFVEEYKTPLNDFKLAFGDLINFKELVMLDHNPPSQTVMKCEWK